MGVAVSLIFLHTQKGRHLPELALFTGSLACGLSLTFQARFSGGVVAILLTNGLVLLFLAIAVVVPASWRTQALCQVTNLVHFYGVNTLSHGPLAWNIAIPSLTIQLWTCVTCDLSVFMYERLQRSQFYSRLALQQSNTKLLKLDHAKSQFFANVSHELRTPLTLIFGALRRLYKEPAFKSYTEVLESGLRNTSRLLFLINELLELAKLERGRGVPVKRRTDMSLLIRRVAANFQSSDDRRISLIGFDEPCAADIDSPQMKKVFYNLLSNAFKFNISAHPQVWIQLTARVPQLQITVSDNGIGIPEDKLSHIFDRFTQVEASATRRYEGTGIGLALVKEIVSQHDGQVTVESELGRGTSFTVHLPACDGDVPQGTTEDEELEWLSFVHQQSASPQTVDEMAQSQHSAILPLVLVVDDNPDLCHYLVDLLSAEYRVETANDGVEALDRARRLQPDIILSDIMMPQMSGRELLQAIRGESSLHSTPMIFLTAKSGSEARIESLDAGADDYLSKPFEEGELLARIRNMLRIRAQERVLTRQAEELQQLNSELQVANTKLAEASHRKSEMVSVVSHDLRNPLAAILGLVSNLLDGLGGGLTDKQVHYLKRIKSNVESLDRMVNDLLDLAKIEAGHMTVHFEPIPIMSFLQNLIETSKSAANQSGISLSATAPTQTSLLVVKADKDKLSRVLNNLLHNALKYTPQGGKVSIECAGKDKLVEISIIDTGPGIAPTEIDKVFDKFFRGQAAPSHARGAGLGLTIVKQLVEAQHGSVRVESTIGLGSRFIVQLPAHE
ncbi:ATP-binding response regulator [Nitrospira sp. Nam74]